MADYEFGVTSRNGTEVDVDEDVTLDRVDLDLDDDTASGFASDLEELAADLEQEPDLQESITLEVPGRRAYSVDYAVDFEGRKLDQWRKKSIDRRAADGFDAVRFATLILANTCRAILKNGDAVELQDRSGKFVPARFASREFQDTIGVQSAGAAVHKLYWRDSSILAAAQAVLEEAGYGDTASAMDPR